MRFYKYILNIIIIKMYKSKMQMIQDAYKWREGLKIKSDNNLYYHMYNFFFLLVFYTNMYYFYKTVYPLCVYMDLD
jgi:hypothetical protein